MYHILHIIQTNDNPLNILNQFLATVGIHLSLNIPIECQRPTVQPARIPHTDIQLLVVCGSHIFLHSNSQD